MLQKVVAGYYCRLLGYHHVIHHKNRNLHQDYGHLLITEMKYCFKTGHLYILKCEAISVFARFTTAPLVSGLPEQLFETFPKKVNCLVAVMEL